MTLGKVTLILDDDVVTRLQMMSMFYLNDNDATPEQFLVAMTKNGHVLRWKRGNKGVHYRFSMVRKERSDEPE